MKLLALLAQLQLLVRNTAAVGNEQMPQETIALQDPGKHGASLPTTLAILTDYDLVGC